MSKSTLEKYKIQDKKVLNFKALPGRLLNNAAAIGETALNWSLQVPERMFYQAAFNKSLANQMAAAGTKKATNDMLKRAEDVALDAV